MNVLKREVIKGEASSEEVTAGTSLHFDTFKRSKVSVVTMFLFFELCKHCSKLRFAIQWMGFIEKTVTKVLSVPSDANGLEYRS